MHKAWIWSRGALVVLALACALSVAFASGAAAQISSGGVNGTTVFSNSTAITQAITTQSLTQRTDTFVTDILGKLNGGTVFDQTFNAAFSDPTVQAGVASARAAITTAGGPGVVIAGPTQISQTVTLLSSTPVTTSVVQSSTVTAVVSTYVGPQTILIGDLGICAPAPAGTRNTSCTSGTPFALAAGQTDIDILQRTDQQILQTTTTTNAYQTASVYLLAGTVQPIGTSHADTIASGFDQADHFSGRLLRAGTDDGGTPPAPSSAPPLAYAEPILADVFGKIVVPPAPTLSRWHSWAEGYGFVVRESSVAPFPGDARTSVGFNGGIGYDLTDNFRLGAAFDFGQTHIDADAVGEHALVNLSQLGVYGAWRSGPFYGTAAGTLGWGDASTSVAPAGLGISNSANNTLGVGSLSAETGYRVPLAGFTLTPSLGAAWFHVDSGGFTESGGALALTGPSQGYDRYKGWLGLKAETSLPLSGGSVLGVQVYAKAVGLGGATQIAVPVSFLGSATPLSISGANAGALGADLGAALAWRLAPNASLYATYDAQLRQNYTAQTGTVGVRFAF